MVPFGKPWLKVFYGKNQQFSFRRFFAGRSSGSFGFPSDLSQGKTLQRLLEASAPFRKGNGSRQKILGLQGVGDGFGGNLGGGQYHRCCRRSAKGRGRGFVLDVGFGLGRHGCKVCRGPSGYAYPPILQRRNRRRRYVLHTAENSCPVVFSFRGPLRFFGGKRSSGNGGRPSLERLVLLFPSASLPVSFFADRLLHFSQNLASFFS